jgi:hypothetical protein
VRAINFLEVIDLVDCVVMKARFTEIVFMAAVYEVYSFQDIFISGRHLTVAYLAYGNVFEQMLRLRKTSLELRSKVQRPRALLYFSPGVH